MNTFELVSELKNEIIRDFKETKKAYNDLHELYKKTIGERYFIGFDQDEQNKFKDSVEANLKKKCCLYQNKIE